MSYYARVAALAVVLFALPAQASGVTLETPAGGRAQPFQRWAERSHARTPAGRFVVVRAECPGADGGPCYVAARRQLFLPPEEEELGRRWERSDFFHELGHAEDAERAGPLAESPSVRPRYRARFELIAGVDGPWWRADPHALARPAPGELFADAYSYCSQGRSLAGIVTFQEYRPPVRQLRRACRLIGTR